MVQDDHHASHHMGLALKKIIHSDICSGLHSRRNFDSIRAIMLGVILVTLLA